MIAREENIRLVESGSVPRILAWIAKAMKAMAGAKIGGILAAAS